MEEHYSGLQVAPQHESPKYPVSWSQEQVPLSDQIDRQSKEFPVTASYQTPSVDRREHRGRKMICGVPSRTFWIVAAVLAVVIIAAGVGGGVGGSLHSKSSVKESVSTAAATTAETGTTSSQGSNGSAIPTSTPTIVISTSTTMSPQYTLLVDCPSSNWTVYTPPGTSQAFRKACSNAVISTNDIGGAINTPTSNLDDCIGVCAAYNVKNASEIKAGSSSICNAVCWRATIENDDWPGQCFGWTTTNISGAFNFGGDTRCSGAMLINQ